MLADLIRAVDEFINENRSERYRERYACGPHHRPGLACRTSTPTLA